VSRESIRAIVEKSRRWDTQASCVPNEDIAALLAVADAAETFVTDQLDARPLVAALDALEAMD
jgi:hypothetical protein